MRAEETSMRVLLAAASAFPLLLGAAPAAAALKPPATLCLDLQGGGGGILAALTLKPFGAKVPLAAGKERFYEVLGAVRLNEDPVEGIPVSGSGHLDEEVLHLSITGGNFSGAFLTFRSAVYEVRWNLVSRTGTVSWQQHLRVTGSPVQVDSEVGPATEVDCGTLSFAH
jgi:hypothetical protein